MTRKHWRQNATEMILAATASVLGPAIGVGLALLFLMGGAEPHEAPTGWSYPFSCCSSIDCREVADSDILEGPDGYRIRQNGETIGYSDTRVKDSPDGAMHLCTVAGEDTGRTICLFVPPRGM